MSLLKVSEITDLTGAGSVYAPGHVVQVVSTTKTDVFSTTSASFTDITGLSASITPKFNTSKILVVCHYSGSSNGVSSRRVPVRLVRDSTAISVGDASGSRTLASTSTNAHDAVVIGSGSFTYLDSPSTASVVTYRLQTFGIASTTVSINRSITDTDSNQFERTTSGITLMEIAQ